jgi:hypothetical protein
MLPLMKVKSAYGAKMLSDGPAELRSTEVAFGKLSTVFASRAWTVGPGDALPAS